MAYSDSDIVWVKLGNCWWPGEVVANEDRLPEGLLDSLKKKPIAVVRFFQEDTFEYVKNPNSIHKYECEKKHEFIKKGLELHRAKNKFMEKFPADVIAAEEKTGGDPKIVENFDFDTKPKVNNWVDLFSSKSAKSKAKRVKLNVISPPRSLLPVKTYAKVTKSTFVSPSTSGIPTGKFPCNMCSFSTDRLFVIMDHSKTHSTVLKQTPKKVPKTYSAPTHIFEESPVSNISDPVKLNLDDSDPADDELAIDIKKKTSSPKKTIDKAIIDKRAAPHDRKIFTSSKKVVTIPKKRKPAFELKNKLLADWSESDTEKDILSPQHDENVISSQQESTPIAETNETAMAIEEAPTAVVDNTQLATEIESDNFACFDFLEDKTNEGVNSLRSKEIGSASLIIPKRLRDNDDSLKDQIDSILNSTEVPLIPVSDAKPVLVEEAKRPKSLPPKERNKRFFKSKCKDNGDDSIASESSKDTIEKIVSKPGIKALSGLDIICSAKEIQVETKRIDSSESALMNIPKKKHLRLLKAEIESQIIPDSKGEGIVITTLVEETIIPKIMSHDAKRLSEPQEGTILKIDTKKDMVKIKLGEDDDGNTRRSIRKNNRIESDTDTTELNKNIIRIKDSVFKEIIEPLKINQNIDVRVKTPEPKSVKKVKHESAIETERSDEPSAKKQKIIDILEVSQMIVSESLNQTVCTDTCPVAIVAVVTSQIDLLSESSKSNLIHAPSELNTLNDLCTTSNAPTEDLSGEKNGTTAESHLKNIPDTDPIDVSTESISENISATILDPEMKKIDSERNNAISNTNKMQHESNKRKKGLKMSSEKMDEMKRLGFIVDQPHGKKILTATGLKRLRQENILAKSKRKQSESSSTSGQNEEIVEAEVFSSVVVETKEISFSSTYENNITNEIEVTPESVDAKELEQPVEEIVALEDESVDDSKKDELNHSSDSQTVQDSTQILALPADNFGGPINSYYLCTMGEDGMAPINNILYSYMEETKQLVPFEEPPESGNVPDSSDEGIGDETEVTTTENIAILPAQIAPSNLVIDTPDGQNIVLDQQMLMTLVAQGESSQILAADGQSIPQLNEILVAIANNEINVVGDAQEILIPDIINQNLTFQHQPAQVSETNALLTQRPRMSTTVAPKILNPSKVVDCVNKHLNLEDSLKSIGVTSQRSNLPPSLELPITVTNPAINLIDSNHQKINTMETLVTPLIQSTKENET